MYCSCADSQKLLKKQGEKRMNENGFPSSSFEAERTRLKCSLARSASPWLLAAAATHAFVGLAVAGFLSHSTTFASPEGEPTTTTTSCLSYLVPLRCGSFPARNCRPTHRGRFEAARSRSYSFCCCLWRMNIHSGFCAEAATRSSRPRMRQRRPTFVGDAVNRS